MRARLSVELREVAWRAPAEGPEIWRRLPERRGVLVRVEDEEGFAGVGEASPLPVQVPVPASQSVRKADELAATGEALRRWRAAAAEARDVRNADDAFALAEEACGAAAAARFAVETALCDLIAARRGVPFAEVLGEGPAAAVPINAVGDPDEVERARAAWQRGIRTFKVKLGQDGAKDVDALRRALGSDVVWRGDANGAWPVDDAVAQLRRCEGFAYVEEPCQDLRALLATRLPAALPKIALDESAVGARDSELAEWLAHPQVAALVVKPTRVGLATSLRWAQLAARAGKACVITHALESPVAMAACAELARAIGAAQPAIAVGLDAHPGLQAWPVPAPQILASEVRAASEPGLGLAARWAQLIPTSEP